VVDGHYLIAVSRSINDAVAELPVHIKGNIEGRR
jgi:hypothetical protein